MNWVKFAESLDELELKECLKALRSEERARYFEWLKNENYLAIDEYEDELWTDDYRLKAIRNYRKRATHLKMDLTFEQAKWTFEYVIDGVHE